ncbi:hypothetical protein HNR01_004087 [Methylorubrum rhodesianum]|jgi:hypothetical protein|nr:hypothetical protein [Methylorubrum rhodesianum]
MPWLAWLASDSAEIASDWRVDSACEIAASAFNSAFTRLPEDAAVPLGRVVCGVEEPVRDYEHPRGRGVHLDPYGTGEVEEQDLARAEARGLASGENAGATVERRPEHEMVERPRPGLFRAALKQLGRAASGREQDDAETM